MLLSDFYKSLLIAQYNDKPNARAEIDAYYSTYKSIFETLQKYNELIDIDTAVGNSLDLIGKKIGLDRKLFFAIDENYFGFAENPNSKGFYEFTTSQGVMYTGINIDNQVLNDFNYRLFLKLKILSNSLKGYQIRDDKTSMQDILNFLFDKKAVIIDNFNMSINLIIHKQFKNILEAMIANKLFVTPAGVLLNQISYVDNNIFGFAENSNSKGFYENTNKGYLAYG